MKNTRCQQKFTGGRLAFSKNIWFVSSNFDWFLTKTITKNISNKNLEISVQTKMVFLHIPNSLTGKFDG